jgi:hypothetical protein
MKFIRNSETSTPSVLRVRRLEIWREERERESEIRTLLSVVFKTLAFTGETSWCNK